MRRFIVPTAAGLVLIANAGAASAQPHEHEKGGGPGQPGIHTPGGRPGPGAGGAPGGYQPERGNRIEGPANRAEPSRQAEPQRELTRGRQTERQQNQAVEQERARAAEGQRESQRNAERERAAQQQKAMEQQRRTEQERTRVQRQREQERNVERERAAEQQGLEQGKRADDRRNERGERVGERRENIREARTRLSIEYRERLHRSFDLERARVRDPKFDFHVGHRVPRDLRLFPVSSEAVTFFPYYRDYRYFVVGDEVCIVDPRTYEVVDVIDQGYWRGRPQIAGLRLSPSQVALIRDSIPRDFPEAPVRLRLALGAEIPGDVELYELSPIVQDRVPELRDYRFVVADDQIVIVDPSDRSIALVIDRA
jgi:uncharacterized protein DUF1236